MDNLSWWYSAKVYTVDGVNSKIYTIILKCLIALPESPSLTPFSLEIF